MSIEITQSIIDAQEHAGIDVSRFTRQEFFNSFYSQLPVSRSVFDANRREMRAYLERIGAEKALSEFLSILYKDIIHSATFDAEYFADFDDFYDSLTRRVNALSVNSHESIFDAQVASLMLAWVGVLPEDAADVKKNGLNPRLNVLSVNDKTYAVPQKAMDILVSYANEYRMIKSNGRGLCEMPLSDGPYLLRTFKVSQMNSDSVQAGISIKMNRNQASEKRFFYNSVRLSGIFSRVLEYESKHGKVDDIPWGYDGEKKTAQINEMNVLFEVEGLVEKTLRDRMTQYRAWKDHFHRK